MGDRRRLTVSKCDPVKPRSPRSNKGEVGDDLKKLIDSLTAEHAGKSVVSVSSKTDRDLARRGSFQAKDTTQMGSVGDASEKWVQDRGTGFVCNKGMKPESPNQDSFSVVSVDGVFNLYGVFDGHGPVGHFVSDNAREKVVCEFLKHAERDTNTGKAFEYAFVETQKFLESDEITKARKIDTSSSGTTCTMAYHNVAKAEIVVAHVGDSRAILAGKQADGKICYIEDLTEDHKPNLPAEKARIESANPPGRVVFDGYYNHRVFAQGGMYPGLNMSRALGDVVAHKEAGLTAVPEIKVVDLKQYQKSYAGLVLFVCSDGVWEFIESKDAIPEVFGKDNMDKPQGDFQKGVKTLCKKAYDSWMADSDNEISDDITAVVVNVDLAGI